MAIGLKTALYWLLAFACNVGGLTYPVLALPMVVLIVWAVVSPGYTLLRYNAGQPITFSRTLLLILVSLLCCAFATTVVQGAYFHFFDHGYFASKLSYAFDMAQMEEMAGLSHTEFDKLTDQMSDPVNATYSMLSSNIFFALLYLIPCTLATRLMIRFGKNRRN